MTFENRLPRQIVESIGFAVTAIPSAGATPQRLREIVIHDMRYAVQVNTARYIGLPPARGNVRREIL